MYAYIQTCMYINMFICMYVYVYSYIYICIYIYIYICIYTFIRTFIYFCTHVRTKPCSSGAHFPTATVGEIFRMCTHAHTHTSIGTQPSAHALSFLGHCLPGQIVYIDACMYIYTHTYTHIYTHIYNCTYAYIQTHTPADLAHFPHGKL